MKLLSSKLGYNKCSKRKQYHLPKVGHVKSESKTSISILYTQVARNSNKLSYMRAWEADMGHNVAIQTWYKQSNHIFKGILSHL